MQYTRLDLTFATDRLPAMSAIVKVEMKTRRKTDRYVAGMWRNTLLADLNWRTLEFHPPRQKNPAIPSWSWASVITGVLFELDNVDVLPEAKILDLSFTHRGLAHLGEVSNTTL